MSAIHNKYKTLLEAHNIEWEEKHHSEEKILNADEIIKSPGIPKEAPMIQKAMAKGINIISEIEFAARYTHAKMVCITGSNGKTTTTSLIYHIFKKAGIDAGLAGNIGHSLALQVAEQPKPVYVIELSSFQLDNMYDFKADIAILLNITPPILTVTTSVCRTMSTPRCASYRTKLKTTPSSTGTTTPSSRASCLNTTSRRANIRLPKTWKTDAKVPS